MAFEVPILTHTFTAGASLATKQFCFVKMSAGKVVVCAGTTDVPVGVVQDAPTASGQAANVWISGISKVVAGAAITAGQLVGTDASGFAVHLTPGTDTTTYIVGTALEDAGASGDIIAVAINCATPHRAA